MLLQSSNVATYIAHGDVALSVLMTTASTLGAIIMTPLLTKTLAGALISVDAYVSHHSPALIEALSQADLDLEQSMICCTLCNYVFHTMSCSCGLCSCRFWLHSISYVFGHCDECHHNVSVMLNT